MATATRKKRKPVFRDHLKLPDPVVGEQLELELWDALPGDIGVRDERDAMNAPMVSISKQPRTTPIEWTSATGDTVRVSANPAHGMATIWDYDVVIYAISQINAAINRGEDPGPRFRFHLHDMLRAIGRGVGSRDYERIEAAIERLMGTEVRISRPGDQRAEAGIRFNLIAASRWERGADGELLWTEIEVAPMLYEAIKKRRSVLALHPRYFDLTGGLERAIYRIARRMAGRGSWRLSFDDVRRRTGSEREARFFNRDLRRLIERDNLPDYSLREDTGAEGPILEMIHNPVGNTVDNSVNKPVNRFMG